MNCGLVLNELICKFMTKYKNDNLNYENSITKLLFIRTLIFYETEYIVIL